MYPYAITVGQNGYLGLMKDAFIPLHPGAAVYFEGNEKNFFEKYGDAIEELTLKAMDKVE